MFTVCYVIPMSFIIYFYSQIVSHVVAHEKALKAQVGDRDPFYSKAGTRYKYPAEPTHFHVVCDLLMLIF